VHRAPTATGTISSTAYLNRFARQIVTDLSAELTAFTPPIGSPYAVWKPTGSQLFVYRALNPLRNATDLASLLRFGIRPRLLAGDQFGCG
jgi:hypothetical protein